VPGWFNELGSWII